MFGFQWFKETVKSKGGIWGTDDVYFTQFRDGYFASYAPNYPDRSTEDQVLSYNRITSQWRYTRTVDFEHSTFYYI